MHIESTPPLSAPMALIEKCLSAEEISSVLAALDRRMSAPLISYHGLRNCAETERDWWRYPEFAIGRVVKICTEQGLLPRNARAALHQGRDHTDGRVTVAWSDYIDFRSVREDLIQRANPNRGEFPTPNTDSHWGFPSFPTITFSLDVDREMYQGRARENCPAYQMERMVERVRIDEFLGLTLVNSTQADLFFNEAMEQGSFTYRFPIYVGDTDVALPSRDGTGERFILVPREDFEAWHRLRSQLNFTAKQCGDDWSS